MKKERIGKKGISPIVATVILVALVVTLSIIVWIFLRGFVSELVTKEEKSADAVCLDDVAILVDLGDIHNNYDEVLISNEGNVPIAGVDIKLSKFGEAENHYFPCAISPGETSQDSNCFFDLDKEFGNVDLIRTCNEAAVTPVLLGTGQKSGKHKRSGCETKVQILNC